MKNAQETVSNPPPLTVSNPPPRTVSNPPPRTLQSSATDGLDNPPRPVIRMDLVVAPPRAFIVSTAPVPVTPSVRRAVRQFAIFSVAHRAVQLSHGGHCPIKSRSVEKWAVSRRALFGIMHFCRRPWYLCALCECDVAGPSESTVGGYVDGHAAHGNGTFDLASYARTNLAVRRDDRSRG